MDAILVKKSEGLFAHSVKMGAHQVISDAEVSAGGEGKGPSPHELLAGALGACTSMTLQMYAGRKGWKLVDAETTVGESKDGQTTVFTRNIRLVGELDDAQKARLLEIANACPIHKILAGKIEIRTGLV